MDDDRKRFWSTFEQIQEDFDRFFDHYAHAKRTTLMTYRPHWAPPCNVYELGDDIHVLVEIAGMRRDQLDLRIEPDRLILRGMRPEPEGARGNYQQLEIAFGEFALEVALPMPVDAEVARAWYQDGFLHVVLPKIPEPRPRRITLCVQDTSW